MASWPIKLSAALTAFHLVAAPAQAGGLDDLTDGLRDVNRFLGEVNRTRRQIDRLSDDDVRYRKRHHLVYCWNPRHEQVVERVDRCRRGEQRLKRDW